jgi:predicted MFS family arabinose efflux permease
VSPRLATAGVFLVNGAGVGTLLPQVPYLRTQLDISKGVIGLCLLAMTLGALIAMPIAGQLLDRFPSRRIVRNAIAAYPLVLAFPLLARSPEVLALLLFFVGCASGFVDISMNAHGAAIERDEGRPIMSSLHAGWSLGGVAGSLAVGLSADAGVDPRIHMVAAALVLCALGVLSGRGIGHADVVAEEQSAGFRLPPRDVILLGVLCILVMVTEGAMNDWSALYLHENLGTSTSVGALGFAFFSAGMALGRIGGDAVVARLGAERVLRGGAGLAAVVLGLFLLAASPVAALPGLALVGLGVANGVPLLFSAAGRTAAPGPAIAAVGTMGYVAFLGGPPFLGFLADAIGLPNALATICLAAAVVVAFGGRPYRSRQREPARVA